MKEGYEGTVPGTVVEAKEDKMSYKVGYSPEMAPKVGAFFNAIGAFSTPEEERTESQFKLYLGIMIAS